MYRRSSSSHPESGYILLAVLFMVALILIALAVATPKIASDIQRDREDDLYHRGEQYKRAIKLYYKKFGRYPSSIDQLENTNNMRFLRKRYVDPMTGKDDWKLIHFGEAHVQPLGLFGQPIQGGGMAATAGGSVLGGGMSATAGGSVLGAGAAASGSMYTPTVGTPIAGSTSSSSSSSSTDSSTSTTSGSGSDSSTSSASGTSGTPTTGTGMGSTPGFGSSSSFGGSSSGSSFGGSSTGSSGFGSSGSSGSGGSSAFGSSGSSFGGAPIVGIASKSTKASIKEYKKQKHYNEWEFVYDPMEDLLSSVSLFGGGSSNVNGTSGTSPGTTTPGTSGSGFGNSGSGSGFGSTSGFGSSGGFGSGTGSGSTPTTPQQPQQ